MFDTDLFDTLIDAARWSKIAGLVDRSGHQVLFDDYEMRQGRKNGEFMLASFQHDIKFLLDLYDFVADQSKRKELRAIFRETLARRSKLEGGPLMESFKQWVDEIVWPLKQRVDEYDFLAKHGCEPPDGEINA